MSGDIRVEIFRVHEFERWSIWVLEWTKFGHFHGVWGVGPVIWDGGG